MDQEKLDKILKLHEKWLNSEDGGIKADFCGKNLEGANIPGANLRGANFLGANLEGANLRGVNLRSVNLCGVNLSDSNLRDSNLSGAYYNLHNILQIQFTNLDCITEAMKHDAANHPKPELFDEWAKGGACPYQKYPNTRLINGFMPHREFWKPGKPKTNLWELWLMIAKSENITL